VAEEHQQQKEVELQQAATVLNEEARLVLKKTPAALATVLNIPSPEVVEKLADAINETIRPAEHERARAVPMSLLQYRILIEQIVAQGISQDGIERCFHCILDPISHHDVYVSPSGVSGVASGHPAISSQVLYSLIDACGKRLPLIFERGIGDIIAEHIVQNKKGIVHAYTDTYPREKRFVSLLFSAIARKGETLFDLALLAKRDPEKLKERIVNSNFYRWLETSVKNSDPQSTHVDYISAIMSPTGQLEGSFFVWLQRCLERWVAAKQSRKRATNQGLPRS